MAETYCGKSCAECAQKEILNCPGCKPGPGRLVSGDCELAKCCRTKGHEECSTCSFKGNCGSLQHRDTMPELRRRKMEKAAAEKAALAKRAPFLGKWLGLLFWLIIPTAIAALMYNQPIAGWLPSLYWPGQILNAACSIAYGLILIKLGAEYGGYRLAGIYSAAAAFAALISNILGGGEAPAWTLIISIPAAIAGLIGEYHEYMTHSDVLWGVDSVFAAQWVSLWKWNIGCFCAMFGGVVLMLLIPILGLLAVLAGAITSLVVGVLKLIYLYQMSKVFRLYDPAK